MGTEIRTYDNINPLTQTLVWTDLVPDLNDPHHYVMDPATGKRWRRLTVEQQFIAEEILKGANYREACRSAGMKVKPHSATVYVCKLLRECAPFVNHLLKLLNEERQSQNVTRESHLKRLDDLGRRAEKEGKYSAAIAAEVSRGRVAGLYAKEVDPEDKKALASIQDIDSRIKQLLGKVQSQEREVQGRVINDQSQEGEKSDD